MQDHEVEFESRCDPNFPALYENLKLLVQMCWLIPAASFQARVIYVISWKHKKRFRNQSFFSIFLADCVTGFVLILISIFFSRPIMYLPQYCQYLRNYLYSHKYIMEFYYPFFRYLQIFQLLLQMLFITNRVSCVIWPINYSYFWRKRLKRILIILLALPVLWIWIVVIAKKVVKHSYGGLFLTYVRPFPWGRSSLFLAVLRSISITFVVIMSIVAIIKMSQLKKRIKESERRLCWASVYLSVCYFAPAITEFRYFFEHTTLPSSSIWYALLVISWDIQSTCSSVVMILVYPPLRRHVLLGKIHSMKKTVLKVTSITQC